MPEKKLKKIANTISFRIALPAFLTIVLFVTVIFFVLLPQLEQSLLKKNRR
jgi:hypothetical protein